MPTAAAVAYSSRMAKALLIATIFVLVLTAGTAAGTAPKATLATFAGEWIGHTRSLEITKTGRAVEHVDDGCCSPVYDLTLQLSNPRGTRVNATATATVVSVEVHDKSFAKSHPRLRAGSVGRFTLRGGVVTDTLTGVYYCNEAAGRKGTCGA